jgi:hypothetical protein
MTCSRLILPLRLAQAVALPAQTSLIVRPRNRSFRLSSNDHCGARSDRLHENDWRKFGSSMAFLRLIGRRIANQVGGEADDPIQARAGHEGDRCGIESGFAAGAAIACA